MQKMTKQKIIRVEISIHTRLPRKSRTTHAPPSHHAPPHTAPPLPSGASNDSGPTRLRLRAYSLSLARFFALSITFPAPPALARDTFAPRLERVFPPPDARGASPLLAPPAMLLPDATRAPVASRCDARRAITLEREIRGLRPFSERTGPAAAGFALGPLGEAMPLCSGRFLMGVGMAECWGRARG